MKQDIGNAELSYLLYESDGPTIVLMHATGFLPWLWHPIARELAPEWRIIAPYFCDHRESDPYKGGLSWMTIAQDLANLCKELAIDRPFMVGHSMGATVITMAIGAFGLETPGIILFEPIFLPEDFYNIHITVDTHPLASKAMRRKYLWSDRNEALLYLRSKALFKNWDEEMLELYIAYGMKSLDAGGLQLACSPKREASLFMGGAHYNPWPLLSQVTCPTLVIEGEMSENRAFIDLKKATQIFEQGTYKLVDEAGHLIPQEKPRESLEIIRGFFSNL
ncbi:MAG: alpha/beta hydrolase [Desulfobacterales bacterium]|nr:alpha/beta hydrolase [Desulfobacterales bacterium]MBF0395681.1 alpha/beta hydrolase [Desulfobacterales bacterium]